MLITSPTKSATIGLPPVPHLPQFTSFTSSTSPSLSLLECLFPPRAANRHDLTLRTTRTHAPRAPKRLRQQDEDGAFRESRAASHRRPARRSRTFAPARIRASERRHRRAHHQRSARRPPPT